MEGNVIADMSVRIRGEGSGAIQEIDKVQGRFNSLVDGVKSMGSRMSATLTTAMGFLGAQVVQRVASAIGGLISTGMEFGKQMANVNSIAKLSAAQLQDLTNAVIDLANDPRILDSPAELAAGLYDIVSAGYDAADSMTILKAAAISATAGLSTTATSADAITTVLKAYGLQADQATYVSNVLFETVDVGKLTFDELASALGNVIPTAAAVGVSIEEVGAAIATMTLNGIDAQTASTYLNGVLTAFLKPTTDLTAALQAHGYASGQDAIQTLGLTGAMDLLNQIIKEGTGNVTDYVADSRAFRAVLALNSNGGKTYADALSAMSHAQDGAGATADALQRQMQSASFQVAKAKQEIEILATLLVSIASPAIILFASTLSLLVSKTFVPLSQAMNDFVYLMLRAFAEGPKVSTLLERVPGPLRGIAGAFLDAADYLGRFSRGLVSVFESGQGVDHFLKGIPEPLREVTKGFLTVADAVGDFVKRIESKGFGAALKILPRELSQVFDGLGEIVRGGASAVADFAITGAITLLGDIGDAAGNLLGWVEDRIAGGDWATLALVIAPITLAPLLIYGLIQLGGDLLNAQGHIWTWVKGKLYGGSGGDPSLVGLPVTDEGNNIPIGTIIADGLIKLGDGLKDAEGDLLGWVRRQLLGITGPGGSAPGGPQLPGDVAAAQGWDIPLGDLAVNASLHVKKDIFEGLGNLYQWFLWHIGVRGQQGQAANPFGQAEQAVSLGDVAVNVSGWVVGKIESVWNWLKEITVGDSGMSAGVQALHDLGGKDLTIESVAVNIGGWVMGTIVTPLWDWLKGALSSGSTTASSFPGMGGTAQGETSTGTNTFADLVSVVVGVSVSWAIGKIDDIIGWVKDHIGVNGSSPASPTGSLASLSAGDIGALSIGEFSVKGIIRFLADFSKFDTDLTTQLGLGATPVEIANANAAGQTKGADIAAAIAAGIQTGIDAAQNGGKNKDGSSKGGFWDGVKAVWNFDPVQALGIDDTTNNTIFDKWDAYAQGFGKGVHNAILHGLGIGIGGGNGVPKVGGGAFVGGDVPGSGGIWDSIKSLFDFGGVSAPALPGWVSDWGWLTDGLSTGFDSVASFLVSNTPDFIKKLASGDILGAIKDLLGGSISGAKGDTTGAGAGDGGPFGGITDWVKNSDLFKQAMDQAHVPGEGASLVQSYFDALKNSAPDTNNSDPGVVPYVPPNPAGGGKINQFAPITTHIKSVIDPPSAQSLLALGAKITSQTFRAKAALDDAKFVSTMAQTLKLGAGFSALTFTSHLAADDSGAVTAFANALALGAGWDQITFTARITVDTSALDAAEFVVAKKMSDIRALLPSSPAKRGAFMKLPTFEWLHRDLVDTLDRMHETTKRGTDHLANSLTARSSYAGRGVYGGDGPVSGDTHVHVGGVQIVVKGNVNGIDDFETQAEDAALRVFKGFGISTEREKRKTGV